MPFLINKKILLSAVFFASLPFLTMAQAVGPTVIPLDPTAKITGAIVSLQWIFWAIATTYVLFMFVMAGFKFLTANGDTTKVAEAKKMVIYGVVGTAVIILAWSVVIIVKALLGL